MKDLPKLRELPIDFIEAFRTGSESTSISDGNQGTFRARKSPAVSSVLSLVSSADVKRSSSGSPRASWVAISASFRPVAFDRRAASPVKPGLTSMTTES